MIKSRSNDLKAEVLALARAGGEYMPTLNAALAIVRRYDCEPAKGARLARIAAAHACKLNEQKWRSMQ